MDEVVSDLPVEVSMVTEVSSETMELSNNSDGVAEAQPNDLISQAREDLNTKHITMETVQYEVVTSDTNMLITGMSEQSTETTPTIEIAPPVSELHPGRRLSYSSEKDAIIAQHVRECRARGEKMTTQQICAYAKEIVQGENPHFTASSGWAQRFLARHSLDIGRRRLSDQSKGGRPLSYSTDTDNQLADYVRSRISEGQVFTNSELRKHAREVVTKENPNFTGSASWAQNFLHRHKISLQSITYDSTDSSSLLTQPTTTSLSDNSIGIAAEITPTTSHPSLYSDPSHDETIKTALAILAGENIDASALSDMASTDPVSLVDLLTNAQQLHGDDGGVSLITSGLESGSGSIYLNLGGADGFTGGFTTQVDPITQAPVTQSKAHDVVAQASRPLSYTRETDLQLAKWVQDQQATGKKVTFASLRAQAKKLICQENPSFNASIGWVTPFLLRHNLDLNLNRKKPRDSTDNPSSTLAEGVKPIMDESLHTAEAPMLTPDLLATAIATSLVEQANSHLPSLAEHARLVLAQSGLTLTPTTQTLSLLSPSPSHRATRTLDIDGSSEKKERSRNRHTLAEKLEVVRLMKEYNVAAHYVCRTLGIANSTFAGWTKLVSQKGAELEALSSNRKRANVKGQGRPLSYSRETDEAVAKWVITQQQLGVQVTPAELGKYATSLILPESANFTASSGWQQKFLQRHSLQLHSTWSHKTTPLTTLEDKLSAEDQTSIPAPIQTEEVVANELNSSAPEWVFGSELDSGLAQWVKDQVADLGSFAVAAVCKRAEELSQNTGFKANLGWAFKFLHHHNIMLDPKPTISQLCATALNRKRSSGDLTATPKKPRLSVPSPDMATMSPSTGNLCEALLALSNQNASDEPCPASMQAAIQTLQSAVAQVMQQQQLEESSEVKGQTTTPVKEKKLDSTNPQSSNTYFHKPAREFSSDEKEEVVRYANATTLQKAAVKYGVAAPTVWRWRVELKLHQPKYTTMQKRYIIKFAEANSLKEASTRYGISGKTIQNWRKSFSGDGVDVPAHALEEVASSALATEVMDPRPSEHNTSDVVTYDNQNFQFIVDGGEVVESAQRSEVTLPQGVMDEEPLSLEVTNEVDIENVGMEYDIVSSEGHAAKPRCTPEEKEHILQFALDHSVREASNKYGISQGTLYYWKKNMSSSGGTTQDTPTLVKTTPLSSNVQLLASQVVSSGTEQYSHHTTASNALANDSLTYVNFLNTVSSLLTSDGEHDKNKSSHVLHSPTDMLVTPFTPHTDIETTATVTIVTSEGSNGDPMQVEESSETNELSSSVGMETMNADEVDISQTVELVESEEVTSQDPLQAVELVESEEVTTQQAVELVESEEVTTTQDHDTSSHEQ